MSQEVKKLNLKEIKLRFDQRGAQKDEAGKSGAVTGHSNRSVNTGAKSNNTGTRSVNTGAISTITGAVSPKNGVTTDGGGFDEDIYEEITATEDEDARRLSTEDEHARQLDGFSRYQDSFDTDSGPNPVVMKLCLRPVLKMPGQIIPNVM